MTDASNLLIDASEGTYNTLEEAVAIATSSEPPRYVARGPRGRFSVFPVGEFPWGHNENWALRRWPLNEITVYLPPDYTESPGVAAQDFKLPPDLMARADEEFDTAISEGELEEDPGDTERNDA